MSELKEAIAAVAPTSNTVNPMIPTANTIFRSILLLVMRLIS